MKRILVLFIILMWGCTKVEVVPLPEVLAIDNIFSVKESKVSNGQSLHFKLPSAGTYTLSLIDSTSSQVINREKFNGQNGENIKKIYTNSLPKGYLILVLQDINKNQLGRTTIINN
jgi:hypothetical protein